MQKLKTYIGRLTGEARGPNDVREIERQFKEEMRDDLDSLVKELNLTNIKALFSKEVALSVVAVAGAFSAPVAGLGALAATLKTVGVAPLIKTLFEYRGSRCKALLDHPISWLYLTHGERLTMR
jgi:hypothetical protein